MGNHLIISNGSIIDGTGSPSFIGDVHIVDGVITEIRATGLAGVGEIVDSPVVDSPVVDSPASRVIDATGLLVTPGWVDIHTHYDGQATWDDLLAPTSWHGVTTLVMGNCGVGFAPVIPDRREWLIGLMEGVEDIPGTALSEGIDWDWETFPEYLDALEPRRWTMDVGTQIAHGPVRAYVMGDRGAKNEPATAEDIEQMRIIVKEALSAGALGFSTSRTIVHAAIDGEPVPGTFAAEDELFGIGSALKELGKGVFELAPEGVAGEDVLAPKREVEWMCRLSAEMGRPVTFAMIQVDSAPELWRELMDASLIATENGADIWPQVAGRATGLLSGHHTTYSLFDAFPAYQELKAQNLSEEQLYEALSNPAVRESILSWQPDDGTAASLAAAFDRTFLLGDPPDYEPGPDRSLTGLAQANHSTPLEVAYEAMMADGGTGLLYVPILNYAHGNLDPVREMLLHPRAASGLADGGAHCGVICDASMPTFMLTHWTRDRTRGETLPLEMIVKKQTQDTARLYGLNDRGTLQPGMVGDVNIIDYQNLQLESPYVTADLPAGGTRLVQGARGYVATIKSGEVTFKHGQETGARPGQLLRGAR